MCCSGGTQNFPSPEEIGAAQARYNRIDQYTPWGSLTFEGPNRNQAVMNLSPESLALQESLMGLRMGALGQLMGRYGATPFSLSNPEAPGIPTGGGGGGPEQPFRPDPFDPLGGSYFTGMDTPNAVVSGAGPSVPFSDYWDPDAWNEENWDKFKTPEERRAARQEARQAARDAWRQAVGRTDPTDPTSPTDTRVPVDFGEGTPIEPTGYNTGYGDIPLEYDLGLEDLGAITENRGRLEQAYMDRMRGLLDPVFAEQQTTLDERLANRGLPTGTEETEILQGRLGRERADAYQKAALDAVLYGGSETRADRAQSLGERLSQFGAQSQARSQLFGEDTTNFNQLASILGLTPVQGASGGIGGFFGPSPIDMMGPYSLQAQMQMGNQAFGGDILGGLLGLGGDLGAAAISDVRLKHGFTEIDIDEVLEKVAGLDVTAWKFFDEDDSSMHIGPMAQDFNAAFGTPSMSPKIGVETIDLISAVGVLMASVKALKRRVEELEGGAA